MEVLLQIIRHEKWTDGKSINVAEQIRVWWMDFFLQNKYPWRYGNSIPQSIIFRDIHSLPQEKLLTKGNLPIFGRI